VLASGAQALALEGMFAGRHPHQTLTRTFSGGSVPNRPAGSSLRKKGPSAAAGATVPPPPGGQPGMARILAPRARGAGPLSASLRLGPGLESPRGQEASTRDTEAPCMPGTARRPAGRAGSQAPVPPARASPATGMNLAIEGPLACQMRFAKRATAQLRACLRGGQFCPTSNALTHTRNRGC
jgi:hypothetical protein